MHHCLFNALRKFFYFFVDAALTVEYVLYIITNVFLPFTPIGYRSRHQLSALFFDIYVPILSNNFTKKPIDNIRT